MADSNSAEWPAAVSARALAYQAMHLAGLGDSSMVLKGQFLMALGLPRAEAAALIGTNDESLRVQLGKAKRKAAASAAE